MYVFGNCSENYSEKRIKLLGSPEVLKYFLHLFFKKEKQPSQLHFLFDIQTVSGEYKENSMV